MILLALIGLVHSESAQYRLQNGFEEVVVFHANDTLHVKSEHGDYRKRNENFFTFLKASEGHDQKFSP